MHVKLRAPLTPARWVKAKCHNSGRGPGLIHHTALQDLPPVSVSLEANYTRIMYKWLNRRSQRRSYNWEQFRRFIAANPLPRPVICHPLF